MWPKIRWRLRVLLSIWTLCFNVAHSQEIHKIAAVPSGTAEGSTEGGTRLIIDGLGFSKDLSGGGNQVYVGGRACKVIDYYSVPETRIVVDTPPGEHDDIRQPVEVIVDGRRRAIKYGFYYRSYRTPHLYRVEPYTASPGQLLKYRGYFIDGGLYSGSVERIRQIGIGEYGHCQVPDEDDTELKDLRFQIDCNGPVTATPGYYNASLVIAGVYGKAKVTELFQYPDYGRLEGRGYMVNPKGESYMVQIVPRITSISHNNGSMAGGLEITIRGEGFVEDSARVQVDIDGTSCPIKSIGAKDT
ncbi:hypothetical protein BSKO_13293 [Bryopsis sp. KO-2023]|nr:hypothetical protein BSKO_13293 [Bryopsis sp. KO-2023]